MGRVQKGVGRVVPAEVLGAQQQAEAILAAAHARAEVIRREAEAVREEGRRQGIAEGRAAAAVELADALGVARAEEERLRVQARPAALRLALGMAEKIVGRAVDLAPELVADIAEQALAASRARTGKVTLRLHPDDLPALATDGPRRRLLGRLRAGAELLLVADPSVGRHGCVVETPAGRLDARIQTQLDALERALAGEDAHG